MPARTDERRPETVSVAPSAPIELMWLWHDMAAGHPHTGDFTALEPLRRRIGGRLAGFWGDGMPQYSTDVIVLAQRSRTVRDLELDAFFARFEDAAAQRTRVPSLRSESAEELDVLRARMERLASDPQLRGRYLDLLRELWKSVEGDWTRQGKAGVMAEAQAWSRAVAEGASYRQILQLTRLWPERPVLDEIADAAAAEGRLTLTPCWFGGKIHVIDVDGDVYVGRGVRLDETSYRKVANRISSNLKALSDPTRLAILLRLARHPGSVTELARQFELSQPTISAHVQVLREAGLLEEKTAGRSAQLSASEEGLRRLFSDAQESLIKLFRD